MTEENRGSLTYIFFMVLLTGLFSFFNAMLINTLYSQLRRRG